MDDLKLNADFLERTSGATMRQLGICIAVLFIVLAVKLNYHVNWAQAYNDRERPALLVLTQLYPEKGDATYDGVKLTGTFDQRNDAYLAQVEKDRDKATDRARQILDRHIEFWGSGRRYLVDALAPFYDLNSPEQRKMVRSLLEDHLKEDAQGIHEADTFQLPLIGISFDSRNRSFVLGFAMFVVLAGLVFALRREFGVTKELLSRHGEPDAVHELCFRQFIYVPATTTLISRKARVNMLRATVWLPVLLQVTMADELWSERWLHGADPYGYDLIFACAVGLVLLLGFLAVYTQSLLTRLWLSWDAALPSAG